MTLISAPLAATEIEVTLTRNALQPVAISYFTAVPLPSEDAEQITIRYGDLTAIEWTAGSMANLDAHILLANTSHLELPTVDVRVSIFEGAAPLSNLPKKEEIRQGHPGIVETLFFERTYQVENLHPGALGRVTVMDIQIRTAIMDLVRQKLWPVYLRVEATISEPTGEITVVRPTISAILKILPATAPARGDATVTSSVPASPPEGSAPPGE